LFCYSGQGGFVLRLTYLLLTLFFHIAIFLVALVGLANFWLPMVGDYKDVLEKELSSFVGNQITIGKIRVDRESENPRWIMENLQLTEKSGYAPIHIRQLALSLDWRESLRTLRLQPGDIRLEDVEFILRQEGENLPEVQGLSFPLPGQSNTALNIERKSPIWISIDGGSVHWMDATNHRTLALDELKFTGEFLSDEITLQAEAKFPSAIGETIGLDAVLKQVKGTDGNPEWDGNLHARTRIFNLAALPSPLLQKYGVSAGGLVLDANIQSQAGKPLHISGEGEVTNLGLRGAGKIPALDNINGTFKADNAGGKVNVAVKDSLFTYPQWFERPLRLDKMDAALQWQVKDDGWHWEMTGLQAQNPDAWLQGGGKLEMLTDKAPDIDLNMTFNTRRTVDNVRDYIPSIVLDSTEEWLKTAIVSGYVPKGEFILRGNPADFPFKGKPGVFDIRFDIEKGVLAYLPEWPEAREVQGELRFHNAGMAAKVKTARIMDLAVKGGTVDIPDMLGETHLLLDLQTQGDLQAHMNYLQSAPIGRNLRDFMQVAKFSGSSDLRLKLDVPLDAPVFAKKGVNVDGLVGLHSNTFAIPEYDQTFSKLNGNVHFDQFGVSAEAASGEYRQQPLQITAATDKASNRITVNLQQQNEPAAFLPDSLHALAGNLRGKAAIATRLELPSFNFAAGKSSASLKVHAQSQLQGVEIKLPAPLGKPAGQSRDVQVDLEIPFDSAQAWQARVQMEKLLTVQARLPRKGAVTVEATMPDLRLGGQSFGDAKLTATSTDVVQAHLQADKVQANLFLPLKNTASGRVNVDLNDIDLDQLDSASGQAAETGGKGLSPADFPSMRLSCRDCRKGDFPIQQLTLDMNKMRRDLQIKTLEIRNPQLTLTTTQGRWYEAEDGSGHTELEAKVHIAEPGKLLTAQSDETGFKGGELNAVAHLNWDSAPFAVSLAKLSGDAQVTLAKGSLSEVDPGIGRLLGLLDMRHLSKRLALDFSDMTGKGITFDEITGHFQLNHGVLTTQDTVVKAAAMVAGIRGSSDLIRKTHDQHVTVMPNLRSTLPVVGAAVGGLGGGAAMLLFNSLTQKDAAEKLKSAGGFRYRVTGSWDKPQVTELKAANSKANVDVLPH
jgi:uncharacterized protein YhdP